jgi:hypothetical protein
LVKLVPLGCCSITARTSRCWIPRMMRLRFVGRHFLGCPDVVAVLLAAGSEPSQRNKHGLTPLACALGGIQGRWKQFSDASLEDWQKSLEAIRLHDGVE